MVHEAVLLSKKNREIAFLRVSQKQGQNGFARLEIPACDVII